MNTGSAPALTWTSTGRWDIIDEHEFDIVKIKLKATWKSIQELGAG